MGMGNIWISSVSVLVFAFILLAGSIGTLLALVSRKRSRVYRRGEKQRREEKMSKVRDFSTCNHLHQ